MGKELMGLLNWDEIASRLQQAGRASDSGFLLALLLELDNRRARQLCRRLVCKQVAERLSGSDFLERIPQCIGAFIAVDPKDARDLCALLDVTRLADRLNQSDDSLMDCRENCAYAVFRANRTVGRRLARLVDRDYVVHWETA
jgi:hypothetical protein